jgi:membrane protease YdiL (CAAX protease family)
LAAVLATGFGLLSLIGLASLGDRTATTGGQVGAGVVAAAAALLAVRSLLAGVLLNPDAVVIRSLVWSRRVPAEELAGLAVEPIGRSRWARLVIVTVTGETVPSSFAVWRMQTARLQQAVQRAVIAMPAGARHAMVAAADVARDAGRLDQPAAFTVQQSDGLLVAVPGVNADVGLTPETVAEVSTGHRHLLGWETVAVTIAFVLPATVAAVAIFARHVARVSNLDEFQLPLRGHLTASLILMIPLYLSTAAVVPVAVVLLARSGPSPTVLGLSRLGLRRDLLPGVGLLLVSWALTAAVVLPFSPLLDNGVISNKQHNTHVPGFFVIYAVVVAAVTAVNEEVVVNGYLMTRLAQLGWRPWPSLAVSLALRTSYHAYYGVALLATVPFGYLATRSFQKHRRLGRPIVAHFLNDAVLLVAAVLTS